MEHLPPEPAGELAVQERFGRLAIERGLITASQLDEAIKVQQAAAKAGLRKRIGDILVRKGYLSPDQLREVLQQQKVAAANRRIGDFEIICKLGEGSMGAVFKVKQLSLQRLVALKVLSPRLAQDAAFREMFIREARSTARLNHPNVVSAIDVGHWQGVYYFAMEYVEGPSLADKLVREGGRLPERQALEYARQVALALHHAHTQGILHRDVKPDNIIIDQTDTAKLTDLGLARCSMDAEARRRADGGMAVGTPYYISPEQAQARQDLTPGTDLYSLGATLYHMLTGQPPFDAPTSREIMLLHVTDPPPDPRLLTPEVSGAAAAICLKLLRKDPRERYASGEALAEAIGKVLEAPAALPAATADNPDGQAQSPKARPTRLLAAATATRHTKSRVGSSVRQPGVNTWWLWLAGVGVLVVICLLLARYLQTGDLGLPGLPARGPATPKTPRR